ncbi:hypothetical protein QE152_g31304 [Popillia japonica]|uniref:Uncharacterized protein n=1 Tax=Popillia japonica TaxID=7064 RepID=A0AAW1JA74_POPJA
MQHFTAYLNNLHSIRQRRQFLSLLLREIFPDNYLKPSQPPIEPEHDLARVFEPEVAHCASQNDIQSTDIQSISTVIDVASTAPRRNSIRKR